MERRDGYGNHESPAAPTRGYIDGCFDIMHSGHYNAIRQAKCLCDVLVVGIHSDDEIEANKALPVMKQNERYRLLEHIKWIDEILYDVPYSPQLATLERGRADFCIHGDDMPLNAEGKCAYHDMREAGRLRIVKRTEGVSTTDMIGRLLTLSRQHHDPPRQASPMGIRVGAEQYLENVLSPSQPQSVAANAADGRSTSAPWAYGSCPATNSMAVVDGLVAKYSMTAVDAEILRKSVGSSAAAGIDDASSQAGPQVRTVAPVQLLTSTRRLVEFASSRQPQAEDRIVYVGGAFDMFHVGHAQLLKDARALGTFLLVGIHEDLTVRQSKGPSFPVMNMTERVLNVCACKWVDEVIIGAPRTVTEDILKTWNINVVARGTKHMRNQGEYDGIDHLKVARDKNILHEVESEWPDLCHDTIVERIMLSRQTYLKRNMDRAGREDDYYAKKSEKDMQEITSERAAVG